MAESRHFYYLVLLNALINVINNVPRTLINHRSQDVMTALLLSIPAGLLMLYFTSRSVMKLGNETLPERLYRLLPKWAAPPLLFGFAFVWYMAGSITLLSFVDITLRYISPDTSKYLIMSGFLAVVIYSARMKSNAILFALETLTVLMIPFMAFFLGKTMLNPGFSWDAVLKTVRSGWGFPTFEAMSAATFIFTGYTNMAVFHRAFKSFKLKLRHLWIIAVPGVMTLLTSLLIPIGLLGSAGVDKHVYPWFSTADSIHIEFFLVERLVFVFYLFYITMSLISVIVHWHVAFHIVEIILPFKRRLKSGARSYTVIGCFALSALLMMLMDQETLLHFAIVYLQIRLLGEFALSVAAVWAVRKRWFR
ncbi:GerAB/ArcD/ProY family transporter [Paenibacillus mucilaginosus]|uniref:Spore germination protein n=2 Tax=Paenibacillus mucilaginosus TaxID=61624 RepID=H6NLV6_9BACL|nr:GerAB/ArcD/ProY family transporter [Paenibacillus mucilaginosus]AEI44105.1 hypothetical protein KNP414_05581 [Paenibacillus mucilaginosus KNP414]AFC31671.1 hypothetical protein PM3016_4939 [Paenibacillus mucilaginosus 3016]MCG7212420.1 GerAB/ArcD/ProY family transporter [Paenibacillus mucilaginosus]WDM25539.1 GerAB/ArcD/ProY family transporter [Paenibacillus mucilaginosus]WFA20203.1 hypothetical protein ERY13_24670 [Paenibacillus mucilaginosus]